MTPELRAERDRVYGPCDGNCGDKYCAEYHAEKAREAERAISREHLRQMVARNQMVANGDY